MRLVATAAVSAALTVITASAGQAAVVYSPTKGPTCQDMSKPEFGNWVCPGPAGYVAEFSDEGNLAGVSIGRGPRTRHRDMLQIRGAGKVFGDKIQWVVVDGVPRAAVLRLWQKVSESDEQDVQTLQVFAIGPEQTCAVEHIDARQPNANEAALARAEAAAATSDCTAK